MNPTDTAPTAAAPTPSGTAPAAAGEAHALARRLVVTYLVLTFAISLVWYALIIRAGTIEAAHGLYVFGIMWTPGVSALVTRLYWQHDVRGEGWGWGATRWQLLSYLVPILYAAVAYGAVWLLGLGGVRGGFLGRLPLLITLGTVMSCTSALGEELGWRGLLVPELAKLTSFTKLSLLSGVIWAAWHMPGIFFADYNSGTTPRLYAAACFAVMVIAISFIFAWMRVRSGSVWTGMLLHASHNLWIQGFFDRITIDRPLTRYFTTEFGAALAITTVVAAVVFWRLRARLPGGGQAVAG